MEPLKLLRSLLFVPANNWRIVQSAQQKRADAIILDLEDAVPIQEKETGRWLAIDAAALLKKAGHTVIIRVNSITTGLMEEDLEYVITDKIDGIMLPKSESKQEILKLTEQMEKIENKYKLDEISIIPLLESAKGIQNAYEIASASNRVVALAFGAADFMRDFGRSYFTMSSDESELLYARSRLVVSARAAGVIAIDTPFLGAITDNEGLIKEAKIAAQLGFKGKLSIHPMHIEPIHQVFSPSENEIELAHGIVEAYEKAIAKGLGATSFQGRMIDEVTYKIAKDTLMIAELIAKRDNK
jgi:citrate lyase subunit beta/citryl-CoA lyase